MSGFGSLGTDLAASLAAVGEVFGGNVVYRRGRKTATIANAYQGDFVSRLDEQTGLPLAVDVIEWYLPAEHCLFNSVPFTPVEGDTITADGITWFIVRDGSAAAWQWSDMVARSEYQVRAKRK
jgi:hypothetical protein